jgi:apolipoprotein N-acyltransferase
MNFFLIAALVSISGLLHGLSFSQLNIWPAGFLILFSVFYVFDRIEITIKKSLWMGYILGLTFNISTSYWLVYTIKVYGHVPYFVAGILFLGYSLITCTRFVIFFLGIYIWQKHIETKPSQSRIHSILKNKYIAWTFLWGCSELFGWQLFPVFGSNMVEGNAFFIQFSDVVGIRVVSLLWFVINLSIYDFISSVFIQKNKVRDAIGTQPGIFIGFALFILLHIYGYFAIDYWKSQEDLLPRKTIGIVQGNAPLAFEDARSVENQLITTLESITEQSIQLLRESDDKEKPLDLLVWPESSVPFLKYNRPGLFFDSISKIHAEYKVPMVISDIDIVRDAHSSKVYNNYWYINPETGYKANYHKILLLPFGEFMPLGNLFPQLVHMFPEVSNFNRGEKMVILDTNIGKVMPSVCYELLPPEFTWQFFKSTDKTAQIIVNITNDAWFGKSSENYEHLMASRIRAVELRLPIIRSTNSGISAYIDMTGKPHAPTGQFVKENRVYSVAIPERSKSLFAIWGMTPFYIFLWINTIFWCWSIFVRKKTI